VILFADSGLGEHPLELQTSPLHETISIVILTYNGEAYLKPLLEALIYQETDVPPEILVIDSSSADSTLQIVRSYNLKTKVIDKNSFSHPGTRNLGVALTGGSHIVFITQDALPTNPQWLKELIRPFRIFPILAASYSRQLPRPECNPLEAKDICGGAPCIDEVRVVDLSQEWQRIDYAANITRYIRFSNVSACYPRKLLQENPFDETLKMVEDQEWTKRMIEKGYPVYYASKSVVMHSHNFKIGEMYQRYFDYGSSFQKFLEHNPMRMKNLFLEVATDVLSLIPAQRSWLSKLKWMGKSFFVRFATNYGWRKGWNAGRFRS